jgi:Putative porin
MKKFHQTSARVLVAALLFGALPMWAAEPASEPSASTASASTATSTASEIEQLKQMLLEQQRQINELRRELAGQAKSSDDSKSAEAAPAEFKSTGTVASTTPILPAAAVAPALSTLAVVPQAAATPAAGPSIADVNKRVDGLIRGLAGFRFSGDFRYRFDVQDRSSNAVAAALQNIRNRYRLRFNVDKDLFNKDGDGTPLARVHFQLSTAPYNNELTNDTDFNGFGTKAPFSVAEAYADLLPIKGLTLRVGRTAEAFADNRQFIWDDDVRFNGFQETYRRTAKNSLFVEFRAGQYILTNPNVQVVPAGSPYLNAGYVLGQRINASTLLDQGVVVGGNLGKKWRTDAKFAYFTVGDPNQIQLASTAAGQGLVTNAVLGATISSNLGATGNATTTNGGAIYSAGGFDVLHYGWNLNYAGSMIKGHNFPFALFLQGTHNTSASVQNNGYMLGASWGQAARLGDVQFQYAYIFKPANAFVSQFTDDDVGTGSGVNIKDHALRVNFGITRWLAWENRLFIQHGISRNDPANAFFVPLQQGYNTTFRYQSHLAFTF